MYRTSYFVAVVCRPATVKLSTSIPLPFLQPSLRIPWSFRRVACPLSLVAHSQFSHRLNFGLPASLFNVEAKLILLRSLLPPE